VSSGAFDSVSADRGVELADTSDSNALLGISYPEGRPVELRSSESFLNCFIFSDCWYLSTEVIVLSDNTDNGGLSISNVSFDSDTGRNLTIASEPTLEQSGLNLGDVTVTFGCRASGGLGSDQYDGSGWVEMNVVASDGNTTIETVRRVSIECIPD